jgi:hypothetical protein
MDAHVTRGTNSDGLNLRLLTDHHLERTLSKREVSKDDGKTS